MAAPIPAVAAAVLVVAALMQPRVVVVLVEQVSKIQLVQIILALVAVAVPIVDHLRRVEVQWEEMVQLHQQLQQQVPRILVLVAEVQIIKQQVPRDLLVLLKSGG
jgi:UDP-N-acetylmuramyl pentapeptide phosphotransferase/UDP-N-acetylglucosamine-1-phosphate transferase